MMDSLVHSLLQNCSNLLHASRPDARLWLASMPGDRVDDAGAVRLQGCPATPTSRRDKNNIRLD